MFGRNKNNQQPQENIDSFFGGAQNAVEQPWEGQSEQGEVIGDIYYELVPEAQRRIGGKNYIAKDLRTNQTYRITAAEYMRNLGLTKDDVLRDSGYEEPKDLDELARLSRASLGAPEQAAAKKGGKFEIEIGKLEGFKLKGDASTLASLGEMLHGPQTTSPSDMLVQMLLNRTLQGGEPQADPYMPVAPYNPYDAYSQANQQQITDLPYVDAHVVENSNAWSQVDAETEDEAWDDQSVPVANNLDYNPLADLEVDQTPGHAEQASVEEKKRIFTARRVGRMAVGAGVAGVFAYGSFFATSFVPFYGPEHRLEKVDIVKSQDAFWKQWGGK